jgi:hypothetical protein
LQHERISEILRNCQESLAELHSDTYRLHRFFQTLHTVAKELSEKQITASQFPCSIWTLNAANLLQDLRNDTAKLRIYYTIAGETSSTYAEISRQYIMPGVGKMDSLSITGTQKGDIEDMINGIAQYSQDAETKIRTLVEEV